LYDQHENGDGGGRQQEDEQHEDTEKDGELLGLFL
jgi:hypothetical protein